MMVQSYGLNEEAVAAADHVLAQLICGSDKEDSCMAKLHAHSHAHGKGCWTVDETYR